MKIKKIEIKEKQKEEPFIWELHPQLNVVCGKGKTTLFRRLRKVLLPCSPHYRDDLVEQVRITLTDGTILSFGNELDVDITQYFDPDAMMFDEEGLYVLEMASKTLRIDKDELERMSFSQKILAILKTVVKGDIALLDTPDIGLSDEQKPTLLEDLMRENPDCQMIIATESNEVIGSIGYGYEFINLDDYDEYKTAQD